MATLTEIAAHLDELLRASAFHDFGPNGVQVPGRDEIATVVTGVSAQRALFERALDEEADAVVVHHGLFWRGAPLGLDRPSARRLKLLLANDISLLAYHLPLDGHLEHGNNALLAAGLGARRWEPFAHHEGEAIGAAAQFSGDGLEPAELAQRVAALCARQPVAFLDDGPPRIRTLGIVSGAGADYLPASIAAGHDAFLTGEPIERAMHTSREAGVHFLAAGHYATETFGVRRLGELLEARFGVRHVWVDIPNPI
ncbi:MAG TPA: Nif3-like dinuclear metal center hexameric protein [Solirubrobacteraceae bacterium]|nr:Nif3-like dinuclear metal center hexameric protein [Solirubrobacteraceae bacterium]